MAKPKSKKANTNSELKELKYIRNLLILIAEANHVDQDNIGKALGGISQSAVSHMINPKGTKSAKEKAKVSS